MAKQRTSVGHTPTPKIQGFIHASIKYHSKAPGYCTGCQRDTSSNRSELITYLPLTPPQGTIEDSESLYDTVWRNITKQQRRGTFQEYGRLSICDETLQRFLTGMGIQHEQFTLALMPAFLSSPCPNAVIIMLFVPGVGERTQPKLVIPPPDMSLDEILEGGITTGMGTDNTTRFYTSHRRYHR